ncbi:MAG: amidohydrolase [Proteobacteria bacterium]|nr:MAG: amidohydrolase [Pseudomonadota bacterium]
MEALDYTYDRGFELFEIDFIWTSDNHLVCLHDWDRTPKWLLNYHDEKPLSLDEFNQLKNDEFDLTPCNIDRLNQWLKSHPNTYIVTDIKHDNIKGLTLISQQIDDYKNRIIPQIYQPEEYQPSRDLGYRHNIWTLYRFQGDQDAVLKHAAEMDLFAITMPKTRAEKGLAIALKPLNIPTYVHTINKLDEAKNYQNTYGLTSVYTDVLTIDLSE